MGLDWRRKVIRSAYLACSRNQLPGADPLPMNVRRLLCFPTGHKPGKRVVVTGIHVRVCARCGRAN